MPKSQTGQSTGEQVARVGRQAAVDPDRGRSAFGHFRHSHQRGAFHSCLAGLVHVLPEHLSRGIFPRVAALSVGHALDRTDPQNCRAFVLHPAVAGGVLHSDCDLVRCGVRDSFRWGGNVRKGTGC